MEDKKTPESPSSDYEAMEPYWDKVKTILSGSSAMRDAGQKYLPKFPHEAKDDYELRRKTAKFTNIFGDIVDTLASKPFEQEITVEKADAVADLIEDIDGQGNHIHTFAAAVFHSGVADAIAWVLVDYTRNVPEGVTQADERAIGARPYWVQIDPRCLKAVYSVSFHGKETIIHARMEEHVKERDGWGERHVERVRVIDRAVSYDERGNVLAVGPPIWTVWEEKKDTLGKEEWFPIETGQLSIGIIPLYPFITGKRAGSSWVVRPALESAADLQIEHYQQESELKYMRQRTAFAMLAGNGVSPDVDENGNARPIPVGPFSVLYAPMDENGNAGEWTTIEPEGASLTFCSGEVDKTEAQLRELGRQPLTAQSGNITTITAAFAGDKAHTVIEAWALNFKDFLENCLKATALWRKSEIEPEVQINTDFALTLKEDSGMSNLDAARDRKDISQETWFEEAKRRGIIGPNRTYEAEIERLNGEVPSDPTEDELTDAVTPPVLSA